MSDPVAWMAEAPAVEAIDEPIDEPVGIAAFDDEEEEAEDDDPEAREVEITLCDDGPSMYEIAPCDDEPSLYESAAIPSDSAPTEWSLAPVAEPGHDQGTAVASGPHDEAERVRNWAKVEAERLERQERDEEAEPLPAAAEAAATPAASEPALRIDRADDDDDREPFDPTRSPRSRGGRPRVEPALPSVQDVLTASHWPHRPTPTTPKSKPGRPKPKAAPAPTTAVAPAQWSLPAWLTWPPATFLVLTLGAAFTVYSWWWADDSKDAAIAGQAAVALRMGIAKDRPLPKGVTPPAVSWWRSTPRHLAQWSNYLSITKTDHGWAESPSDLIEGAAAIAPLDPVARLVKARMGRNDGGPTNPAEGLGLSRDAVSLAWTARASTRPASTRPPSGAIDGRSRSPSERPRPATRRSSSARIPTPRATFCRAKSWLARSSAS